MVQVLDLAAGDLPDYEGGTDHFGGGRFSPLGPRLPIQGVLDFLECSFLGPSFSG